MLYEPIKKKFRAWHEENKTMVFFDMGKAKNDQYQCAHVVALLADNKVIMQATGFNDIKGNEIYEGDILELDAKEWADDKSNVFIVDWNGADGSWSFGGGTSGECDQFKTIIGNVFENPELIY